MTSKPDGWDWDEVPFWDDSDEVAPDPPKAQPAADNEEGLPCVPFQPVLCPHCQSKKSKIYGRNRHQPQVRYHVCKECNRRFLSEEVQQR